MKVKKYTAQSMPEAMKKVRAELGNDAVILNSKVVHTGGFLGLFKKRNIEVLAAVDAAPAEMEKTVVKQKKSMPNSPLSPNTERVEKQTASPLKTDAVIKKELELLEELKKQISLKADNHGIALPEAINKIGQLLQHQEIDADIQAMIIQKLMAKWYAAGEKASENELNSWLVDEMKLLLTDIKFGGITFTKKYVNVVGPTGVGKTTTLAKMAAESVIHHKKKVAFITVDTYRIAAIEQLKTYAKILNVPLDVCYTLEDFNRSAKAFTEYDIVFIDTAGRNFREKKYVDDLRKTIDFEKEMETFLVLSLTSKQKDMAEIYRQFSQVHIDKFIFTKADETSTFGAMFNMLYKHKVGAAYITNGQDVPDDMIAATPETIVKTIIEDD